MFKAQLTHPHKSRMQFPQNPHPHWAQNGRISTILFHNLKYLEGNCMRNVSPADERRPQGLRAHIHTLTMKAFSDSSAKRFAQHGASSGSSAKKLAQHTPTNTRPDTKLALHTPTNATPGTKLAQQPLSHRMCGTKLALHTPVNSISGTKLALLTRNGPMWRVLPAHGELSTAVTTNKPRRANFFTLAPTPGRAGEFLLRAQPPLRLGILPLTSTPPSWRRPSSARKINRQPPTSAPTIRR